MTSQFTNDEEPGLLGYLSLAVFFALVVWGVYAVYSRFLRAPAPAISLSGYFMDSVGSTKDGRNLKIKGDVHLAGQPLKEGSVRLTVTRQEPAFEQSVSADLKNGRFEIEDPSFSSLRPDDQIRIKAEVSSSQLRDTTTDELYLNIGPPSLPLAGEIALWGAVVAVIGVFLFAFTGKKTPGKNRTAIILSYCIIGISLAVPLLAPVLLLRAFPRARCAMNAAPAGIVVTPIGKDSDVHTQWALNIGGYSTQRLADLSGPSENSPTTADASQGRAGTTLNASSQPTNVSGTIRDAVPISENLQQRSTMTPNAYPGEKQIISGNAGTSGTNSLKPSGSLRAGKDPTCSDVMTVDGGLVIPLYVVILSVIGGAINMTRKVPRYQREGEHSEVSLPPVGRLFSFKRWKKNAPNQGQVSSKTENPEEAAGSEKGKYALDQYVTAAESVAKDTTAGGTESNAEDGRSNAEGKTAEQQSIPHGAKEIDSQLDEIVKEQVRRTADTDGAMSRIRSLVQQMRDLFDARKDDDRILGFESFEDWLGNRVNLRELLGSNWRVELLNQYMYLISAPFLAIVAYYLLELLGVASKQPIVVLISFSVGLISERIVSSILGVATGYLRGGASSQPVVQQGQG